MAYRIPHRWANGGSYIKCENFDRYFQLMESGQPNEAAELLMIKVGDPNAQTPQGVRRDATPHCIESEDIEFTSI